MADPGWGFASGFLTGTQQEQAIQLNKFALEEAPVTLEKEKLALDVAKQSFEAHNKFVKLVQSDLAKIGGETPVDSATNTMFTMAKDAAAAGLPEESLTYIKDASTMQAQQSEVAYRNWEVTKAKTDQALSILAGATDKQSWDQAQSVATVVTGNKSPFSGMPWSPELKKRIVDALQTQLQKAELTWKNAQAAKDNADAKLEPLHEELLKAQTKAANALAVNREKVLGLGQGASAKAATVTATKQALVTAYEELAETPDKAFTAARPIAIRAEQIVADTGKKMPEAIQQAIHEAQRNGELSVHGLGPTRVRSGQTPKSPLPFPTGKDGAMSTDPADYKDNMWYPNGGWWDAERKGFVFPDDSDEDNQ